MEMVALFSLAAKLGVLQNEIALDKIIVGLDLLNIAKLATASKTA